MEVTCRACCQEQQTSLMSDSNECRKRALILILLIIGGVESNPGPIEEEVLEIAALGRPFHLGMLYDARSDSTIPAMTLWDNETLRTNVDKEDNHNVKVEVIENDTISDKTTALNVKGDLKLSFLSGLIEASGSGSFLRDHCDSTTQERITLQYKSTSHWEKLGMDHISKGKMQYPEVSVHQAATHVVTQIQYGTDAFFLFDRQITSSTKNNKSRMFFKAEIEAINVFAAGAKCAVAVVKAATVGRAAGGPDGEAASKAAGESAGSASDEQASGAAPICSALASVHKSTKKEKRSIRCKYYGDFSLSSYPTNIEEARNAIQELHKQLQTKPVPKTIWLYPLALLDNKAPKLLARISVQLMTGTEKQLQALIDAKMIICGMLEEPEVQRFDVLKSELIDYKNLISNSELLFQENLRTILPKIRGGNDQEEKLSKVLYTWENSVFSPVRIKQAVSDFKKEIAWLKERLRIIKQHEIEILTSSDEITEVSSFGEVVPVIALEFNIADFRGSLIEQCTRFMESPSQQSKAEDIAEAWCNDSDLRLKAAENINRFLLFVASTRKNCSIAIEEHLQPVRFVCVPNKPKSRKGDLKLESPVVIIAYNQSIGTVTELPFIENPPIVTNLTADHIELSIYLPRNGLQHILSIFVWAQERNNEYKAVLKQKRNMDDETIVVVKVGGLSLATSYLFKVQALTPWGLGPASAASKRVETPISVSHSQGIQLSSTSSHEDITRSKLYTFSKQTNHGIGDAWIAVQHGDPFPEELGHIRAFDIPGLDKRIAANPDPFAYIAQWKEPGGEAVFGCAWKELGLVKARFTFRKQVIMGDDVGEFRILKLRENDVYKYHWVEASVASQFTLLNVDGYCPAVVFQRNNPAIGKARPYVGRIGLSNYMKSLVYLPVPFTVWTCKDGRELKQYSNKVSMCYLLAKTKKGYEDQSISVQDGDASLEELNKNTENQWISVRHGDAFPEEHDCIRAFCIPGLDHQIAVFPDVTAYIALWFHPDGSAVFGCAWEKIGVVDGRFTWDDTVFNGNGAGSFLILKIFDKNPNKYRWVQAMEASEQMLLQIGGFTPAVVFCKMCGKDAVIGRANWATRMVWTCENGKELCSRSDVFANCFLLTKQQ